MNLITVDYLFLYSFFSIWFLLLFNMILAIGGFRFYNKISNMNIDLESDLRIFPNVSILIPAHNEEKVIARTIRSMVDLNYPKDRYEIIVINDNSSDRTGEILSRLTMKYNENNIKVITTSKTDGGKGKSNALNIGYKKSKGEFLVVYDADNTPEKNALKYLVYEITRNDKHAAVVGKFRTINKKKNWLTRFINIETLSFQWMAQAGRYQLFNICTIPGTNFILRKEAIDKLGGWDISAIAEDTEISFRLLQLGYTIGMMPLAVTWEQEPETLPVWFKQRTRWVKGNIYVLVKYFPSLIFGKAKKIWIDILYFISVYILFLTSILLSYAIFILGVFTEIRITLQGNFMLLWLLAYSVFVLQVMIALTMERGESTPRNLFQVIIMYFTYCQLWVLVAIKGSFNYINDIIFNKEVTWYKTERFE